MDMAYVMSIFHAYIWKGRKPMKRMKRTFAMLLAMLFLFNIPITALADSWDDTLDSYKLPGNVMVHADKEKKMMYLEYVGPEDGGPHIPEAFMLYYYGKDSAGNTTIYPAYCMEPPKPGAGAGDHMVNASTYIDNPKVWGIVTNGYPYKSYGELGLADKYEAYFATKIALWTYLLDRDINDWIATEEVGASRVLTACKKIYNAGIQVNAIPKTTLIATPDKTIPEKDNIDSNYVSLTYTVTSNMPMKEYEVYLVGDVPEGTKVTDLQNREKDIFNSGESFKVVIPSNSIANMTGTFVFVKF